MAYGYSLDDLTPQLADEFMAYTLIHLFAKLPDILGFFGDDKPGSLGELEKRLWFFAK